ncbi:hypothetical protein ACRAWF_39705 [Streptomyces sp. L7]
MRARIPGVNVLVHPECKKRGRGRGRLRRLDREYIIKALEAAPAGSKWAIGTERESRTTAREPFRAEGKEISLPSTRRSASARP